MKLADISVPLVPLAPTSSRTSGQRAANSSVLVVAGSLAVTRSKPSTTTTTKNYDTGARFFTFEPSSNSLLAFFVLKSVHRTWLKLMRENIKSCLCSLELVPKRFAVIHIRSGDRYLLKNNMLNSQVVKKIVGILSKNMKPGTKYLILSDNNQIKALLKTIFPQVVIKSTKIAHLGESVNPDDNSIMETLLDFYLMSNAFQIISFSPYNWGSGFSKWCSVLYKIPYTQIQVLDKLS